MEIKQREVNLFDVFIGNGWDNYIQVALNHKARQVDVKAAAEHIEITPKLQQLVYWKIKKHLSEEARRDRPAT